MNGFLEVGAVSTPARRAVSIAVSLALSAALLFYGVPLASAASSSRESDALAASPTSNAFDQQVSWTDRIEDMLQAAPYVEGQAVAIVAPAANSAASSASLDSSGEAALCGSADLPFDLSDVEELARTTGDAYESAFDEALPLSVIEGVQRLDAAESGESGLASVEASDVEVRTLLVKKEGSSTEEILRALSADPSVIWAEPNYVGDVYDDTQEGVSVASEAAAQAAEATEPAGFADSATAAEIATVAEAAAGADAATTDAAGTTTDPVEGVTPVASTVASSDELADATAYQWAFSDGAAGAYGSLHQEGFDVNLSGWNDPSATNAAGVVAVVDTGIDSKNPDLEPVMFDMGPYAGQIGGDEHGYNATGDGGDSSDVQGHGTHCAGIVAAAWNGFGVSGAANGAKLISVRAADSEGRFNTASAVKAYAYIGRAVDAGVDVRVCSNSWGGEGSASRATYLAVQAIGQKGVAVIFAAGNEHTDVDAGLDTAKIQGASNCTTIVDSAMMTGVASEFTNYGKTTTDLFAPGSTILSTAISQEGSFTGTFFPCLIKDRSSLAAFTDFSEGSTQIEAWTGIEQTSGSKAALGRIGAVDSSKVGYDPAAGVLKISKTELEQAGKESPGSNIVVSLKVPVNGDKLSEISNVSAAIALDGGKATDMLGSSAIMLEAVDSGGKTSTVGANAGFVAPRAGWNTMSVSTERALKESGEDAQLAVHTASDGGKYIWVHVTIPMSQLAETSADGILIDCVGAGSKLSPYVYLSGTSMATPCVAGLAAVASTQMEGYEELDKSARAEQLTCLLKSSVATHDAFTGLCSSNGMIDASKFSSENSEQRNPVIASATLSDDEQTIVLAGASLGSEAGSVDVGGKQAEVKSWSDNAVVIARPSGLVSGYLKFELSRANGKSCSYGETIAFTKDVSSEEVPVYEESIDTPDVFDSCSKFSTMAALDGSLYVFGDSYVDNEAVDSSNEQSKALFYRTVWRYEIESGTWSEVESLPCALANVSSTLWDGKLLVMGSTASEGYGGLATKKLFSYDPDTACWSDLSDKVASDDVPYQAALVNVGGKLLLIGGSVIAKLPEDEDAAARQGVWVSNKYDEETAQEIAKGDQALMTLTRDNVRSFDLATGKTTVLGSCLPRSNTGLARSSSDIQTALCGDKLYIYGGARADVANTKADQDQEAMERLVICEGSITRETIGSYGAASEDRGVLPAAKEGYGLCAGLASSAEGPVLAGLLAVSGKGSDEGASTEMIQDDSFVLKGGSSAFASIGKRVNYTPTVFDRAIAYRGKLYVLGHDFNGAYETVMRSTALATNELPGDVTRSGDDRGSSDNAGASGVGSGSSILAKTGDGMASISALAVVAACASLAVALEARRRMARRNVLPCDLL